jgi:exonuclease III
LQLVNILLEELGKDKEGNFLQAKISVNGLEFILTTIYGPNKDTPDFYQRLRESLSQERELPNIICGDWNLVLDQELDTINYVRENNKNSRHKVQEMIESMDLLDIWRAIHPERKQYSWQNSKKASQRARLDFF